VLQEKGFNEYEHVNTRRHDLFPLTCIEFENLPVNLTLFSPFIFNDIQNSTIPVYCFIFKVKNEGDDPMSFSLSFNFENDIGWRNPETGEWNLAGNYNLPIETEKYRGFELKCNESEKKGNLSGKEYIGNMTILTTRDCKLEEYETDERKIVKITKEVDLAPKEETEIPFILATCFPYFSPGGKDYSTRWDESWKVREYYEWYWKNSYENSKEMAIEAIETYGEWLEK
jgi:Predicted bile acid beta-glucosidase